MRTSTGFFHDLQGLRLKNVRGAHTVSLETYTSTGAALKLLRSSLRFPSTMQTRDAFACIEEVGLPAILYIAILRRVTSTNQLFYRSVIQEMNTALGRVFAYV
jgi:hypothetical protein